MAKQIPFSAKYVEQKLSEIGAKIADADDCSAKAAVLAADSQTILELAQNELSELYIALGDILPKASARGKAQKPVSFPGTPQES